MIAEWKSWVGFFLFVGAMFSLMTFFVYNIYDVTSTRENLIVQFCDSKQLISDGFNCINISNDIAIQHDVIIIDDQAYFKENKNNEK